MYSPKGSSGAVQAKNRIGDVRASGLCSACLEDCPVICEVTLSGIRGPEALYPAPFGKVVAGSQKEYPTYWDKFQILGTAQGAHGVEADSDEATFPNVVVETTLGEREGHSGIKVRYPSTIPGLGSTDVARVNWPGLAMGSALYGIPLTVGENVVGMDMQAEFNDGGVVNSPALRARVEAYRRWQQDGYGDLIVQENVEDRRLGVLEYAIQELGVKSVELKWGQGAKDIGGEVKITDLEKAQELANRGYIVLPDPHDSRIIDAFQRKLFREFERHSRVGMVTEEDFASRAEELKDYGAENILLKTGAYRFGDLANALAWSAKYGVDVLTIDGAGGGTGMSPWRMMNEWGIPPIELFAKTYEIARAVEGKGLKLPDIVLAGGFAFEDHVAKGLAFGEPFVKAIGMASAPLAMAMKGRYVADKLSEGTLPSRIKEFGNTHEEIFYASPTVIDLIGKDQFKGMEESENHENETLAAALTVFGYYMRVDQGLRQFMTGARKFNVNEDGARLDRNDLVAITEEAARVSGIQHVMDHDREEVDEILKTI